MWPFTDKAQWQEKLAEQTAMQNEIAVLNAEIASLRAANARLELRVADIDTYKEAVERLRNVILQIHELISNDLTPVYRDEK
jgi:prefoldin subunit 5